MASSQQTVETPQDQQGNRKQEAKQQSTNQQQPTNETTQNRPMEMTHNQQQTVRATMAPEKLIPFIDSVTSERSIIESGHTINKRWHVVGQIGSGTFGQIYKVHDNKLNQTLALKAESIIGNRNNRRMVLESKVLLRLQGKAHVPIVYASGATERINFIVMQLLSRNLADLRRESPRGHFSVSTTVRLMSQAIEGLAELHHEGFLHRDIKPSNMAVGVCEKTKHRLYIIDFNLVRSYRDENGIIRPPRKRAGFRGTLRYVSLRVHERMEQCPADDLWSVWYTMVELAVGQLPWRNQKDHERVQQLKKKFDMEKHCAKLPKQIVQLAIYLKTLTSYEDMPDYELMGEFMKAAAENLQLDWNDAYDWETEYRTVLEEDRQKNGQNGKIINN